MTSRDLKKLSRAELLEMLIAQSKEVAALRERLDDAQKRLNDRTIIINKAGSLAEASMRLNGVLEAAQNAAEQYVENVRRQADKLLSDTKKRCGDMEDETRKKCEDMIKMRRNRHRYIGTGSSEKAAEPTEIEEARREPPSDDASKRE